MEFSADVITQFMGDMLLPFMRISGMLATMVGLSAKTVPTTVRALLTLFITLIILPVIPPVQVDEVFSVGTFMLVIQQLIIGISLGFISTMVLNTFVLAGQVVAMQTGLGFASIVDPVNGINVPAVGQFYLILATLLFWALDGHLAMIRMVVMSFTAFPVGEAWLQPEQFREIATIDVGSERVLASASAVFEAKNRGLRSNQTLVLKGVWLAEFFDSFQLTNNIS